MTIAAHRSRCVKCVARRLKQWGPRLTQADSHWPGQLEHRDGHGRPGTCQWQCPTCTTWAGAADDAVRAKSCDPSRDYSRSRA
eukprot:3891489-Rhodomonas_salina.1